MKKYFTIIIVLFSSLLFAGAGRFGFHSGKQMPISLLAGEPDGGGFYDGTGIAARFYVPTSVAVDTGGNVFVADQFNQVIRKITPAGVVTTFAGSAGFLGSADGTGSAARFSGPFGITVDSSNNLYVADSTNCTIRKITPTAVVTTLAGTAGVCGNATGTGPAAQFLVPYAVATDSTNVFVADTYNHIIRKIVISTGVVTTLAGSGSPGSTNNTGTLASFNMPFDLTVDGSGNVFVADTNNNMIRKVTPAGVVTTFAGAVTAGSTNATGTSARFSSPMGIAFDSVNSVFYISDAGNLLIRKATTAAAVTTYAGTVGVVGNTDATGTSAKFNNPQGLDVDSSGNVYVPDANNLIIRKIDTSQVVTTFAGKSGNYGTADGTGSAARFYFPNGIVADSTGNLFVTDSNNHTIRKITPRGVVTTFAGQAGVPGTANGIGTAAQFNGPNGITIDSSNNLYVADLYNHGIRKITSAQDVTTYAGTLGTAGMTNATGTAAKFNYPYDVTIDSTGNLFVADTNNHLIRKITTAKAVTTFAGTSTVSGSTDGTGTAAKFNFPYGIDIDTSGNLFVADTSNNTIRKITTGQVVTTFAGSAGIAGTTNGTGTAARLNFPYGVRVDKATNNVYIGDTYNHLFRKITPAGVVTTFAGAAAKGKNNMGFLPGEISLPTYMYIYNKIIYFPSCQGVLMMPLN